jgi:hypothetical protein
VARKKLSYGDFRPLKSGELGYSKTARRYQSMTTGEVISRRQFEKRARKPIPPDGGYIAPGKPEKTRPELTKDIALQRFQSAKDAYVARHTIEIVKAGGSDTGDIPIGNDFYQMYDVIKHPTNYPDAMLNYAHDYFWGDDLDIEWEYDFPDGDTP